jgi:hypothetical protein
MVTTYEFNVNVRITDWSLSSMSMEKLIDDTTPFDASIFVSPTMED